MVERYHFYDGVHHVQVKLYNCEKKNSTYFIRIYIKAEHKVQIK